MFASFSYASFSASENRPGGWSVGGSTGDIADVDTAKIVRLIPTNIDDGPALTTFPDRTELAQRTRRFAWLRVPGQPEQARVFLSSAAAGQDATGRPGNVFTIALVSTDESLSPVETTTLMYSPSIPAPFGKRRVDDAPVPTQDEIEAGTLLNDAVVTAFLRKDPSDLEQDVALPVEFGKVRDLTGTMSRSYLASALAARISEGRQVVLLTDVAEGPLWVAALARELPDTHPFTWSTYERATSVDELLALETSFCVVPLDDQEQLSASPGVDIVSAADGTVTSTPGTRTAGTAGTGTEPASPAPTSGWNTWAGGKEPTSVRETGFDLETAAAAAPSPSPSGEEVNPFASQTLVQEKPVTATVTGAPEGFVPGYVPFSDEDEDFIRHGELMDWDFSLNRTDAQRPRAPRLSPQPATSYLFLPTTGEFGELGRQARTMVLALISYGDDFMTSQLPEKALLGGIDHHDVQEIIAEAALLSADQKVEDDQSRVSFANIQDAQLREAAKAVRNQRIHIHGERYEQRARRTHAASPVPDRKN